MNLKKRLPKYSIATGLAAALALTTLTPSAHANVFASNIKINGTLKGVASVGAGSGATITYILNEHASQGVSIKILQGATVVRTIAIAGGSPGTTNGLNTVVWDGKNDSSAVVPAGNYTVSVTAQSSGYAVWTQIISNANPKVYWPSGIAVDTRTDSAYYGRVMVANGVDTANNVDPHPVGVIKFNADGSEADEGQSSAGVSFRTDNFLADSIRSLKYGTDDRVYWNDWVGSGKITAADMAMTTNQVILDTDLVSGNPGNWADIDVTDPGTTNAMCWFADGSYPSVGIFAWPMTNNGVADPGVFGINLVTSSGLDIPLRSGFGMMIDEKGNLLLGEVRSNPTDNSVKLISITNLWPSAVDGSPTNWWNASAAWPYVSENINWQDGAELNSTFCNIAAAAIDSRSKPKYGSAAFNGSSGGLKVFNLSDGTVVTNIQQDISVFDIGTCFDNAGNVYAGNATTHNWQAFSPPGPNQATTPAVATLTVTAAVAASHITGINVSGGTVTIKFTGDSSLPASAFKVYSSTTVNGTYTDASAVVTGSAGSYTATVAVSGNARFYRIKQ
jgi:hypothetical protein